MADLVEEKVIDDANLSLQIKSLSSAKNEIDVCFVKDNAFYYIECKAIVKEGDPREEKSIVRDEIYKKGALLTQLGLGYENKNRALICTTLTKIDQYSLDRAKDYGVEIIKFDQSKKIKEKIRNLFKGS